MLQTCVRAELTVTKRLCTTDGILHGGVYMAFADTLGAVGTILNLPEDATTATTESKTNFFRPALMNSVVYGECTAVNMGRRLHTWQSHLTNSDGKLLAVITQTQMVIKQDSRQTPVPNSMRPELKARLRTNSCHFSCQTLCLRAFSMYKKPIPAATKSLVAFDGQRVKCKVIVTTAHQRGGTDANSQ